MKEKVLITGSNGFIGKQLKKQFNLTEYEIVEFNSSDGDIAKTDLQFENINHVFHLAGKSFVPDSWKNPKAFYDVNFTGTLNVLELCRKTGAGLTFISSYVYGIPQHQPINENHPINPANPYGHSKLVAEEICQFYSENFKLHTTIIRPFNIYGTFQSDHFLIPTIIKQLFDEKQLAIDILDLMPKRDYLFLDDLISAIMILYKKNKTGIYNVGSGTSLSVEEIIKDIMEIAGIQKKYVSKEVSRKNEIPEVIADISKIKKETGWVPGFTFKQGIAEILKREQLR
ncbi:MAG TPA: NAD(P)-dependent oxidoreductase [Bacteroidia bacterium]|jgi:nucleoside-diphosphate-sugar epimerase|nr:NAD(P)-dependent oxidoreductase [Bacteroidia bacterium]